MKLAAATVYVPLATYSAFEIAFSCFSSGLPDFLHVALNSFRKHCFNVLSTALCFIL